MPSSKIAQHVNDAQRRVYASLPHEMRVAHALARILQITGKQEQAHRIVANLVQRKFGKRHVVAYSEGMITKLVEDEIRKEGVRDELEIFGESLPNLDWGKYYLTIVNKFTRKFNLDKFQRDEILSEVVSDTVMGTTLLPDRGRSTAWKHNVVGYLQEWAEAGHDERTIKKLLFKFLGDKTTNIVKRYMAVHVKQEKSFESGRPGDDYDGGGMYEDLFTMDGLSSGQMSSYMSLLRDNPEVRNLVKTMDKWLQRQDDEYSLIWKAYMSDPTASMENILKNKVRGPGGSMPLWEALGFEENSRSNVGKLAYRLKKLQALLKRKWPEIEDALTSF